MAPNKPQSKIMVSSCEGTSGISPTATLAQARASLRHPAPIHTLHNSYIFVCIEVRDASGEPVQKKIVRNLYVPSMFDTIVQVPGHCYYILTTYLNGDTGELFDQEITGEHCVPAGTSSGK